MLDKQLVIIRNAVFTSSIQIVSAADRSRKAGLSTVWVDRSEDGILCWRSDKIYIDRDESLTASFENNC